MEHNKKKLKKLQIYCTTFQSSIISLNKYKHMMRQQHTMPLRLAYSKFAVELQTETGIRSSKLWHRTALKEL